MPSLPTPIPSADEGQTKDRYPVPAFLRAKWTEDRERTRARLLTLNTLLDITTGEEA